MVAANTMQLVSCQCQEVHTVVLEGAVWADLPVLTTATAATPPTDLTYDSIVSLFFIQSPHSLRPSP